MVPPLQFAAVLSRESEVGNGILASLELGVFFCPLKCQLIRDFLKNETDQSFNRFNLHKCAYCFDNWCVFREERLRTSSERYP